MGFRRQGYGQGPFPRRLLKGIVLERLGRRLCRKGDDQDSRRRKRRTVHFPSAASQRLQLHRDQTRVSRTCRSVASDRRVVGGAPAQGELAVHRGSLLRREQEEHPRRIPDPFGRRSDPAHDLPAQCGTGHAEDAFENAFSAGYFPSRPAGNRPVSRRDRQCARGGLFRSGRQGASFRGAGQGGARESGREGCPGVLR